MSDLDAMHVEWAVGGSLKVVLFPATGAFHRAELARVVRVGGVSFVSAEDAILAKLDWHRRGGGVSERQLEDIASVIRVQGVRLDRAYLAHWASELGVSPLLDRVLQDAGASPGEG